MLGTPKASYAVRPRKQKQIGRWSRAKAYGLINGQSAAKLKKVIKMYQITKEKYQENLQKRFPQDDLTVLDPFTGASKPVKIRCNQCNQIFSYNAGTTLYNKKRTHFCPLCNCDTIKELREACKQEDITVIQSTPNVTDFWEMRCNKCGTVFKRLPTKWLKKSCPECGSIHGAYTKEQRQEMIDNAFGKGEFEVLDTGGKDRNFVVRHKCGYIRSTQYSNFIRSSGCPKCSGTMSKGEQKILNYLDSHGIEYVSQQKMGDTKQSFDFFLPALNVALEFNGAQHYKPIEIFGGEERFTQQQEYDLKKKEYCEKNNIILKVISYLEYENIDNILDDFFKKFNDQSQDVEKD